MDDAHVNDEQLDRLVDGELTDEQYRRLLASLDDEPAGWRRCALAFLESQALGRDLGAVAAAIPPSGSPAVQPLSATRRSRRIWPLVLAMAGCFLVAFTIGSLVPGSWFGSRSEVAEPTAGADRKTDRALPDAPTEAVDEGLPRSEVARDATRRESIVDPEGRPSRMEQPDNMMVIEFGEGENSRRFEVPYYEMDEYESAPRASDEPLLSDDLVRALRRAGHELRQRQQVLPIHLDDGRRVLVPMEETEIVPVSGRGYQ